MGTAAPIIGGAVGGAGSFLGGKEANKPRTTYTNQTTTNTPFGPTLPFLDGILEQGLINFANPPAYPDIPSHAYGPSGAMLDAFRNMQAIANDGFHFGIPGDLQAKLDEPSQFLHMGQKFINDILFGDAAENPHVQAGLDDIQREGEETFLNHSVPFSLSRFNRAGRGGSGAAFTALKGAEEESLEAIGQNQTLLINNAFNSLLGAQTSAASFLPAFEAQRLAPIFAEVEAALQSQFQNAMFQTQGANDLFGAATQLHGFDLAALEAEFNRQMFENTAGQRALQELAGFVLPISQLGGTTHTSGQNVVPGASINPYMSALLGGAGGGSDGVRLAAG